MIEKFENDPNFRHQMIAMAHESKTCDIALVCFCKPLNCHGDNLANLIEWIIETDINMQ